MTRIRFTRTHSPLPKNTVLNIHKQIIFFVLLSATPILANFGNADIHSSHKLTACKNEKNGCLVLKI